MQIIEDFSGRLLRWFEVNGRKDLPWQENITAYRVWISEIMLQQTQVATVIPYYQRFMGRFPTVEALAAASMDEVLHLWSGLGYYSRAKNLHRSAEIIVESYHGELPRDLEAMMGLPGIGRSTAGAILSIAYKKPTAILDGNVKRVLARVFAISGWPGKTAVLNDLWQLAETHTPKQGTAHYSQAMMDLGATVCKRSKPDCTLCPMEDICAAHAEHNEVGYPGKKPKKILPVKNTHMVVFRHKQQLFLYQRPMQGIWPGLWSFPEYNLSSALDLDAWCLQQVGEVPVKTAGLTGFRHTFSHYHLDISIDVVDLKQKPRQVAESKSLWYDPKSPQSVGLAAPVSRIIKHLKSE